MRVRRLIATAALVLSVAACGTEAKQVGYEALRTQLQQMLSDAGLTNVVVKIEEETDENKVKGTPAATSKSGSKPTPSAGTRSRQAKALPGTNTVTYDILSATFNIPGLVCRGNVEQRLSPPMGTPYFDEVILPDGTEVEVNGASREFMTAATIFDYAFNGYPQCRQNNITAPPTS